MESWVNKLSTVILLTCLACGIQDDISLHTNRRESNAMISLEKSEKNLEELIRLQDQETIDENLVEVASLQLAINENQEIIQSLKKDPKTDIEMIRSKYRTLLEIFNREKLERKNKAYHPFKHTIFSPDDVYPEPYISIYHPRVLAEVQRVFDDFGPLFINETVDAEGKIRAQEVQVPRPWSGYWHPLRDQGLYKGKHSPLHKLDTVLSRLGHNSQIALSEQKVFGSYSADGWEGLCDAWALAATTSLEPVHSKKIAGVIFSPSDLKALLTFSHTKYSYKQYGITYRGDAETDGTYQDLKPEAFHKVVTHVLSKQNRAVVIDETPGVEIWNKPLFRYRWEIRKDPDHEFAFLVKGFPWLVNQRSNNDSTPTNNNDIVAPIYNYRLYVDQNVSYQGRFKVVAGQWIKNSRSHHPGNVKVPSLTGEIGSHNDDFNKFIPIYKKLFL